MCGASVPEPRRRSAWLFPGATYWQRQPWPQRPPRCPSAPSNPPSRSACLGPKGFTVEVLFSDHQNKPDVGAGIARQWFDRDGVDMITDVNTSSVALAVN